MGQSEVVKSLKKGNWRTVKQMAKEHECSEKAINNGARIMFRNKELERRLIKKGSLHVYEYKLK
jgi:hypothetical protein